MTNRIDGGRAHDDAGRFIPRVVGLFQGATLVDSLAPADVQTCGCAGVWRLEEYLDGEDGIAFGWHVMIWHNHQCALRPTRY